ncbi:MAG TPA: 50S ribosomal protein L19 [Candidatus Dojkabacteria bacterium]|nr:50S ribosomal protein L19 [Candidatus Dojkabacteria bacterium]
MDIKISQTIAEKYSKNRPDVKVGDTVKLHVRIKEGNKERVQIFEGLVLALKGAGINRMITVRKISTGVGVERIIPLASPLLDKIEVIKRGKVRQSKIYYMKKRIGKKALRIGKLKDIYLTDSAPEAVVPETAETEVVAEMPVEATAETPKE